jgi:putative transposase
MIAHRPANHLPGEQIEDYGQVEPALAGRDVGNVRRGMSTREIVGHRRELYGIEVSPDPISAATDAVLEQVATWQARPLEAVYPLIFFDAPRVKIRDEGKGRAKGGAHRTRGARRRR